MAPQEKAFVTLQRVGAITGGVSAGTFGTAVTQTIPTWAKGLLGLVFIGVLPTYTAEEGKSGILRLNSKDLGIANEEFLVGPYNTSGPATNSSGYASVAEVISLDIKLGGGESISVDYAPAGASTAGVLVEVFLILTNNPEGIPADWKAKFPNILPVKGGKVENAQQLTTARTALTAIKVPTWAKAIVGVKAVITKTGAITAGEECIGHFDIANTVGITPIEIPVLMALSATLGTPVGTGQHVAKVDYLPIYIPVGGKEETFTPYIILRTAVTTDNRVAIALAWR